MFSNQKSKVLSNPSHESVSTMWSSLRSPAAACSIGALSLSLLAGCSSVPREQAATRPPENDNNTTIPELRSDPLGRKFDRRASVRVAHDFEVHLPDFPGLANLKVHYDAGSKPGIGGVFPLPSEQRKYIIHPIFLLERSGNGVKASVFEDGSITLPIIVHGTKGAIPEACAIVAVEDGKVPSNTPPSSFLTPMPNLVYVTESYGSSHTIRFQPLRGDITSASGRVDLRAKFPNKAAAQAFLADLESGKTGLEVSYAYDGSRLQQAAVVVRGESISTNATFKAIQGGEKKYLSRDIVEKIAAESLETAGIMIIRDSDYEGNLDFRKLVDQMWSQLEHREQSIRLNNRSLAEELSNFGIDPNEFKADIINRLQIEYGNQGEQIRRFSEEIEKQMQAKGSGGLNILEIIKGSASGEIDKRKISKVLRESLDSWNITYNSNTEGTIIVPKSIQLALTRSLNILSRGAYEVGERVMFEGEGVFYAQLERNHIVEGFDRNEQRLQQRNGNWYQLQRQLAARPAAVAERDSIIRLHQELDLRMKQRVWSPVLGHHNARADMTEAVASPELRRDERITALEMKTGKRFDNIRMFVTDASGRGRWSGWLNFTDTRETGRWSGWLNGRDVNGHRGGTTRTVELTKPGEFFAAVDDVFAGEDLDGWQLRSNLGSIVNLRIGGGSYRDQAGAGNSRLVFQYDPAKARTERYPELDRRGIKFDWELDQIETINVGGSGHLSGARFRFRPQLRNPSQIPQIPPLPPSAYRYRELKIP